MELKYIPSSSGVKKSSLFGRKKPKAKNISFAPREQAQTGAPIREINGRIFTFDQIQRAANNFTVRLGRGGSAFVFRGRLENEGPFVAIKLLKRDIPYRGFGFLVELESLSRIDHPNIIKLVGCCSEAREMVVVYEYMPLGSLDKHLRGSMEQRTRLDWNTRVKIALGAARGLHYLHYEMKPSIIHRDIKCANILLDEGYNPKLSDFALATAPSKSGGLGTFGYMAPEFGKCATLKIDVYGFGVMLLEIFTCRKAVDNEKPDCERLLAPWAQNLYKTREGDSYLQMVDPVLQDRCPKRGLHQVLYIAIKCLEDKPKKRPSIYEIVEAFDYIGRQIYDPPAQSAQVSQWAATSSSVSKTRSAPGSQGTAAFFPAPQVLQRANSFPVSKVLLEQYLRLMDRKKNDYFAERTLL